MDINLNQSYYYPWKLDLGMETISIESGFRYHPIEQFHPFFVQASVGIIRLNYVLEKTSPRYLYQAFDELAVGAVIPLFDSKVIIIPKLGLTTLFLDELPYKKLLGGYNQLRVGVNVGYQF